MKFSSAAIVQLAGSLLNYQFPHPVLNPIPNHLPTKAIYDLPGPISAENLVERANGNILIPAQGAPYLYEVNPRLNQSGGVLHNFVGHENIFGVTEVDPDVFYVLAANYTHAPTWTGIQGSNALYELDFANNNVSVTKVFDIPEAYALDGLITINHDKGFIMAGDTQAGILYLFDVRKRKYTAVYQSPLLNQTAKDPQVQLDRVGVNGLKYYNGDLYFTDTSRYSLGKIPLDVDTGRPTGPAVDLAYFVNHPDDLCISSAGIVVVTILEQGFMMKDLKSQGRRFGPMSVLGDYFGANACQWGRNEETRCTLYATYNLGIVSSDKRSGLIALDTTGWDLAEGC